MKWHLTQHEADQPEIDIREDDEDLSLGYAYWHALATTDENPNFWVDSGSGPGWVWPTPRADT
jgi:hypothetical protein